MNRFLLVSIILLLLAVVPLSVERNAAKVGSKKFTESVILGEIVAQSFENAGVSTKHFQELGGTRVAFNALVAGEIDLYPEYSGTIRHELFSDLNLETDDEIVATLQSDGVSMTPPLGFNNTYALAMTRPTAQRLGVASISDLARHPEMRIGLTNEFIERGDGWNALSKHYGFRFANVTGLDHDLAYRQLASQSIDVMDVYSTDAKIREQDLVTLIDDRKFFPRYDAVLLYRNDLVTRFPELESVIGRVPGTIPEGKMIRLNHRVESEDVSETQTAAEFLAETFGIQPVASDDVSGVRKTIGQMASRTIEHIDLVRRSLIPAIFVGIPLGVVAFRNRRVRSFILGSIGVFQTIPALALLVMLMPLVAAVGGQSIGTGSLTAVAALFLYSLLPIVRGTYTGLSSIEPYYIESSVAMGLPPRFRLWNIELPLSLRSILAGIRTAAVMNIGFATLGALIGAGGYGQPILTGIRLADTALILQGAIPAAVLALAVQGLFDAIERWLLPAALSSNGDVK